MIRVAWKDFSQNLLGTGLSSLTSGVLIFAFLLLTSLSLSLTRFADTSGPPRNIYLLESEVFSPEQSQLTASLVDEVSVILGADAERVDPLIFRILRVGGFTIQLRGVSPGAWQSSFQLKLSSGNWPSSPDEIVIGNLAAEVAGWEPGSALEIYGSSFTVSGIADGPGTKTHTVWMSHARASELFDQPDSYEILVVNLNPSADPLLAKSSLEEQLSSNKPYAVYFEDALLREYGAAFRDLRAMSVLLTVIAIVAVTAAAHNQAWLAAEQRRVSLGVLRTLGFTSRSVALYLNLRALGINLIGYGLAYFSALFFIQGRLGGELHSIAGNQLALSIEIPQALLGLMLSSAATWMGTWISSRRAMSSSPAGLIGRGPGATYS